MGVVLLQQYVFIVLYIQEVFANSTTTEEEESFLQNGGVKAALTCGLLAFLFVIALVVAKVFDICLDRQAISDDASDVSDHTRDLIRARLSVIQFKRKEMSKGPGQKTLEFFRRWAEKAKIKRRQRQEAQEANRTATADKRVIKVEQGPKTMAGTRKLPVLNGSKMAGGSIKPTNITSSSLIKPDKSIVPILNLSVKTFTSTGEPVSSRPVSSLSRDTKTPIQVNVTATDMPSIQKAGTKSVHFEDEVQKGSKRPPTARSIRTVQPTKSPVSTTKT